MIIDLGPRNLHGNVPLSDTLLSEASDVCTVEVAKDVKVGYTLLNRDKLGEKAAIVAIGGFMSSLTSADRAYEGVQLASTERPILMLDLPGHGLSSPHNARQIFDLCIKRDTNSSARPLTDAVLNLLPETDPIDYFAISHGGLISLKATEQDPNDRVGTVFAIDLPAVKRRTTLGTQLGYVVLDGMIGKKRYMEALEGSTQKADFENFKELFDTLGVEKAESFIKNNPALFFTNLFMTINARPVAFNAWQNVMDHKSARVDVVVSEKGHISNPKKIGEFIAGLPTDQQDRSSLTVVEGEDHNIGIVHLMPRAVSWAQQAYAKQAA